MKKALILSLLLAGCAYTHEPKLTEAPKDAAKYAADKSACRSEAFDRFHAAANSHGAPMFGFGVAGTAAAYAVTKKHPDDDKNVMEMTDECLIKKGYKLAAPL